MFRARRVSESLLFLLLLLLRMLLYFNSFLITLGQQSKYTGQMNGIHDGRYSKDDDGDPQHAIALLSKIALGGGANLALWQGGASVVIIIIMTTLAFLKGMGPNFTLATPFVSLFGKRLTVGQYDGCRLVAAAVVVVVVVLVV